MSQEVDPQAPARRSRSGFRVLRISVLMGAIFLFFRFLPDLAPERPANLMRQMTGQREDELCDFTSLGFFKVSANRSPVTMRVQSRRVPGPGEEVRVTAAFTTPGGKPIAPADIEVTHTEKIHLLVVDSSLEDYHHIHPQPARSAGEYEFTFTPRRGGNYRIFADFTPKATGRPVQAAADFQVNGEGLTPVSDSAREAAVDGLRFTLEVPDEGLRVRRPAVVTLRARAESPGEPVRLEPVMEAYAHLVAFDANRSGFAHMHPVEDGLDVELDEIEPALRFVFYVEEPGYYRIWGQVKIEGEQRFVPFGLEVL